MAPPPRHPADRLTFSRDVARLRLRSPCLPADTARVEDTLGAQG